MEYTKAAVGVNNSSAMIVPPNQINNATATTVGKKATHAAQQMQRNAIQSNIAPSEKLFMSSGSRLNTFERGDAVGFDAGADGRPFSNRY